VHERSSPSPPSPRGPGPDPHAESSGGARRLAMARWRPAELLLVVLAAVLAAARRADALSVTVTDTECIHEFVPYEGDTVSGNFVVVDHDIFWSSDHPGIDLTVPARCPRPPGVLSSCTVKLDRRTVIWMGLWVVFGRDLAIRWV